MVFFHYDLVHLLDGGILIFSFTLLCQRRIQAVITSFTWQSVILSAAAAWQASAHEVPHLYITAGITLVLKALMMPFALREIVRRLQLTNHIETVIGTVPTLIFGVLLVGLSIALILPVTADFDSITRDTMVIALAAVLLGLLMMMTRQTALTLVIGFMSLENGLILAAVGAAGIPFIVELTVSFSVLAAFFIGSVFFFHIRDKINTLETKALEKHRGEE